MDDTGNIYIIDASVLFAGLLLDEVYNISADKILEDYKEKRTDLLAPSLITYEVLNGIRMAFLRKRIPQDSINILISLYKKLEIRLFEPVENHLLSTAISNNLSVYDSAYVSLMILQNKPLITADKKLYNQMHRLHRNSLVKWIEEFKQHI